MSLYLFDRLLYPVNFMYNEIVTVGFIIMHTVCQIILQSCMKSKPHSQSKIQKTNKCLKFQTIRILLTLLYKNKTLFHCTKKLKL